MGQAHYAIDRQPRIALWNLASLGRALLSLLSEDKARSALGAFQPAFTTHFLVRMREKPPPTWAATSQV